MDTKNNLDIYLNKLNFSFNKITDDYDYIFSNIKLLNNEIIINELLTNLEISMNDLSINMQSILFIIKNKKSIDEENKEKNEEEYNYEENNHEENNHEDYNYEENKKNNEEEYNNEDIYMENKNKVLINNTVKNMMPYLFLYLMLIDKESILNSSSFYSKKNDNSNEILNGYPYLKTNNIYIPELD